MDFNTVHGGENLVVKTTAQPMETKPACVKTVSDQHADFQPNRDSHFSGSASDFSSKNPVKGVSGGK